MSPVRLRENAHGFSVVSVQRYAMHFRQLRDHHRCSVCTQTQCMIRQIAPDKSKGSFACSAQLLTGCLCHRETSSLKLAKLRGCTFVNQYVVIKYLGRGACGRVFLCMDMTDNRLYAVKVCSIVTHAAQSISGPCQVICSPLPTKCMVHRCG